MSLDCTCMDTVVFTVPQFYALIGGDLVASNHRDDTVPGGSLKHRECYHKSISRMHLLLYASLRRTGGQLLQRAISNTSGLSRKIVKIVSNSVAFASASGHSSDS